MSLITNPFQQLIRRKLWPVALLLVAALVAVPLKLTKKPEPAPALPASAMARAEQQEALAKPIVSLANPSDTETGKQRRRVLGQVKDPFEPAPLPKAKKKKKAEATPTPASAPSGGNSAPPSSGPPSSPTPAPTPTVTIPKGSIKVKFGTIDTTLTEAMFGKLDPLPSDDNPVLVFEGLDGGTAVFSVPGLVTGEGDGKCLPDPSDCATVKLHAGDTEFLTVTDPADSSKSVQYQLELVKVYTKKTVVAAGAAGTTESSD
jgi:hypothetical protein